MTDISALLSDQPLIDESTDTDNGLDTSLEDNEFDSGQPNDEPPDNNDDPARSRNQKVPLAALHEERTKRQTLEAEAQQLRQAQAQTLERMTKLLEAQQQAQQQAQRPAAETPPSFVDDPEGAFNYVQQQLVNTQRQMQEYLNGTQQQSQAQQQHQQLAQQVSVQETQFTQTVPDYPLAADYFYQRKVAEYTAITGGDELAARQQVANDYKGIAVLASRLGKNPAELMYNAAKAMGYTKGTTPNQQRKPAPTTLADAHGTPRAPDEKGQPSASDIASMTDKEFDEFFNKMARGGVQKPRI